MSDGKKLAAVLNNAGLPGKDKSMSVRPLRLTNSNIFDGRLDQVVREVVSIACTHASPRYRQAYDQNARLLITNLVAAAFQMEWLALSTKIAPNSYQARLGLSRRRVESLLAALIQGDSNKYCQLGRGGYVNWGNRSNSKASQYYPSPLLIEIGAEMLYETIGDFDNYQPYEYKGEERWDTNEIQNTQILEDYNVFMRGHTWAFKGPTVRKLGALPFTGGRVYTPYQNIVNRRVQIREKTLLDGEPLIECDFKANHPAMLAKLSGVTLKDGFYESIADAAQVSKSQVKLIVTRAIGCKNKKAKQNMLYGLLSERVDKLTVDRVLAEAYRLHSWVGDHDIFFSGMGERMQWLEGEIAIAMFSYAVTTGIPMVNIHDAYAVNEKHAQNVTVTMHAIRDMVIENATALQLS